MNKVLLIDDDFAMRELYSTVLSMEGIECQTCPDRQQGLAMLAQALEKEAPPDMILLDIKMDGLAVKDFCQQCREFVPEVRVIGFSSFDGDTEEARRFSDDFCGYLQKPDDIQTLIPRLKAFLGPT